VVGCADGVADHVGHVLCSEGLLHTLVDLRRRLFVTEPVQGELLGLH
jgi:hypothetical protein